MSPVQPPSRSVSQRGGWIAGVQTSCRGRSPILLVVMLIYFPYVGYQQYLDPINYYSWFYAINLCIHEGGHLLLRPFGIEILHVAGGTIAQLAAPIVCMVLLTMQGECFGIPICLGWLSTNLIGVGVYMADARARELPLVTAEGAGSSDGVIGHDWAQMFTYFNLMDQDTVIGFWTRAAGSWVMIAALVIGVWMLCLALLPPEKYVSPTDQRNQARERRSKLRR